MSLFDTGNRRAIAGLMATVVSLGIVQASLVLAATQTAPAPNPLTAGSNPITSPVPGVDITVAGPPWRRQVRDHVRELSRSSGHGWHHESGLE